MYDVLVRITYIVAGGLGYIQQAITTAQAVRIIIAAYQFIHACIAISLIPTLLLLDFFVNNEKNHHDCYLFIMKLISSIPSMVPAND